MSQPRQPHQAGGRPPMSKNEKQSASEWEGKQAPGPAKEVDRTAPDTHTPAGSALERTQHRPDRKKRRSG